MRFAEIPNGHLCFCNSSRGFLTFPKMKGNSHFTANKQAPAQRRWGGVGRT
jgi:hypothetical protein